MRHTPSGNAPIRVEATSSHHSVATLAMHPYGSKPQPTNYSSLPGGQCTRTGRSPALGTTILRIHFCVSLTFSGSSIQVKNIWDSVTAWSLPNIHNAHSAHGGRSLLICTTSSRRIPCQLNGHLGQLQSRHRSPYPYAIAALGMFLDRMWINQCRLLQQMVPKVNNSDGDTTIVSNTRVLPSRSGRRGVIRLRLLCIYPICRGLRVSRESHDPPYLTELTNTRQCTHTGRSQSRW